MTQVKDKRPTTRRSAILWIAVILMSAIMLGSALFLSHDAKPNRDFRNETFTILVKIRDAKKREVIEYFENVRRVALGIRNDADMRRFFRAMRKPGAEQNEGLEYLFDKHYVDKYREFYDILLVNADGFVFHSVRQESDFHTNLFDGALADSKLVQQMRKEPNERFVEYEYYAPSEEPAAFFVTPFHEGNEHLGWFVLQCSINQLNTILTDRQNLGRTGEVYLVNEEKWMLTDSRFVEDSTSLRLSVDTWAVKNALEIGSGTRIIEDYRGVNVLSAFEKFDVFETSWVIMCEIDEDEVITEHYKKNAQYYNPEISSYLARHVQFDESLQWPRAKRTRVDINEYAKAEPGERLETHGVATCTVVAVAYPGRFIYLAHIGPTDAIYQNGAIPNLLLNSHDFMHEIIEKIRHYDVVPNDFGNLEFTIVASHDKSFGNAVRTLVESGVGLSKIKVLYNPRAEYANVAVDPATNLVAAAWTGAGIEKENAIISARQVENLAEIVDKL